LHHPNAIYKHYTATEVSRQVISRRPKEEKAEKIADPWIAGRLS
jgi:hypothetical protein